MLGGGLKYVLFSTLPGEMIQFDEHIFQMGWNHQPGMFISHLFFCMLFNPRLLIIGLEKVEVVGPLNLWGELACSVPTFDGSYNVDGSEIRLYNHLTPL